MSSEAKPREGVSSNIIHISNRSYSDKPKNFKFYVYLSKVHLKEHNDIELHGLGQATALCVKVAEILVRHNYTKIKKIESMSVQLPENGGHSDDNRKPRSTPGGQGEDKKTRTKIKLIIKLEKTDKFDELTKDLVRNKPTPN